jgi:hypothetical protein
VSQNLFQLRRAGRVVLARVICNERERTTIGHAHKKKKEEEEQQPGAPVVLV